MVALCPGFKLDHTYWRDGVSKINRFFFLGLNRIFIGNGLTVSLEVFRSRLDVCAGMILWQYTVLKFHLLPKRHASLCLLSFPKAAKEALIKCTARQRDHSESHFDRATHNPVLSFGYCLQVLVVWVRLPQKYECLPGDLKKHCNWIWAEEAACIHVTFSGTVSWVPAPNQDRAWSVERHQWS